VGSDGAAAGLAGKFVGSVQVRDSIEVASGHILFKAQGRGIVLRSPDGAKCGLLSIDNAGNIVLIALLPPGCQP
jgi:hypothetical protein